VPGSLVSNLEERITWIIYVLSYLASIRWAGFARIGPVLRSFSTSKSGAADIPLVLARNSSRWAGFVGALIVMMVPSSHHARNSVRVQTYFT
jgi:hypothetical protein